MCLFLFNFRVLIKFLSIRSFESFATTRCMFRWNVTNFFWCLFFLTIHFLHYYTVAILVTHPARKHETYISRRRLSIK